MTESRDLVEAVGNIAGKLKIAAIWRGSKSAVDACRDDFVFELLCFLKAAEYAQGAFKLRLLGNTPIDVKGRTIARWPKKPGKKANFSFLELRWNEDTDIGFQLCPGIRIQDIHGKARAPDINLLAKDASDFPTYCDLLACWDAKYCTDPQSRLPDTAVADFIYTFVQLGAPQVPSSWCDQGIEAFSRSGVLTNGIASTEPDGAFDSNGLAETSGYPSKPSTRP